MEFRKFSKIERLEKAEIIITQKLHGTNAHILVFRNEKGDLDLVCGSRNRYITPEHDNFGFASYCYSNKEEIISKLGEGRHDGEWCGPGINSGEGLEEKTFVLFDFWRYPEDMSLPPQMVRVPVLYRGPFVSNIISLTMDTLREKGSTLVEGFMRPEGVVITLAGTRFKKAFLPEETQWKKNKKERKPKQDQIDYNYLCQPIRLEKLLSRDEAYIKQYPKSLGSIVQAYVQDLIDEQQIKGSEDDIKFIRKDASRQIFSFVKEVINENT